MYPRSSAAAIAARSRSAAVTADARTTMIASSARTAHAAMASPSTTACGSRSISVRSTWAPGSASKPFATTTRRRSVAVAQSRHLRPAGNPPPPRPRRPDSLTMRMTASGDRSDTASRYAFQAPRLVARSMSAGSASRSATRASSTLGQSRAAARIGRLMRVGPGRRRHAARPRSSPRRRPTSAAAPCRRSRRAPSPRTRRRSRSSRDGRRRRG